MPVRRLEADEQDNRLTAMQLFLREQGQHAGPRWCGYLFYTDKTSVWRGYIMIDEQKYKILGTEGTDSVTGRPTLEIEFQDDKWLGNDGQQFVTAHYYSGKSWRCSVYVPSALRGDNDDEWVNLSFHNNGNPSSRPLKGKVEFAWRVSRRQ